MTPPMFACLPHWAMLGKFTQEYTVKINGRKQPIVKLTCLFLCNNNMMWDHVNN